MSTRIFVALAIAAMAVVAPGLAQTPEELASPKLRIQWAEFKKLYDEQKVIVVDVRDEASFNAGHIPGSRVVPLDQVERRAPELKKLGKPIVTYCA